MFGQVLYHPNRLAEKPDVPPCSLQVPTGTSVQLRRQTPEDLHDTSVHLHRYTRYVSKELILLIMLFYEIHIFPFIDYNTALLNPQILLRF